MSVVKRTGKNYHRAAKLNYSVRINVPSTLKI